MLKKRLVGVVTIKNGWAVQSFGYGRYLPLGKPECLVENLDRWGADEILVQAIDRSMYAAGPDLELLNRLARLGLGTPLVYGGGISSVSEGIKVIQSGADRILVDALLHGDLGVTEELCAKLGAQALIASLPLVSDSATIKLVNYQTKSLVDLALVAKTIQERVVSEVLITDCRHEGVPGSFDAALIDRFPFTEAAVIAFGGISDVGQIESLLAKPNVAAVGIGNFLSYREHAIQRLKEALPNAALRPPIYKAEFSLLADA